MLKITRVSTYSKRWWNREVVKARKIWAKDKKKFSGNEDYKNELK